MNKKATSTTASVNFIIGMGRSGTTLLTSILNAHSQIYANPENNFLLFLANYLTSKKEFNKEDIAYINKILTLNTNTTLTVWKGKIETNKSPLTKEQLVHEIYMSSSIQTTTKEVKAIYDKNPEYTVHVDVLKTIFPDAKYIAITRNYLDNIASRKRFGVKTRKRFTNTNWVSIYTLAISWDYYNRKIIRMLDKEKIFHIRYEDLVEEPITTLKRLFDFIEISYEDEVLNYHQDINLNSKINRSQLSETDKLTIKEMHGNLEKPIFNKRVGVWEQQLTKRQRYVCDIICRNSAKKLGYSELKEYSLFYQISISIISIPFKVLYHSYLILKDLKYYKLPLSIRVHFFTK
ncbi:MAG: sulfotransferase [Flavobacteriales bacterium]|nr:sulfotransferase [Flavobacteriales bacterium]